MPIIRDFILEDTETFALLLPQAQSDPAVRVGDSDVAVVSILDEIGQLYT